MVLLVGLLITYIAVVNSNDATVFFGRNPFNWEDPNCILYYYKGFFDSMLDLAKTETDSHWAWENKPAIDIETLDANDDIPTRTFKTGAVLNKIFEFDKVKELHGIIGVSHSPEGALGSEIVGVPYIHTYTDDINSILLEVPGILKARQFNNTLRLGPSVTSITEGILDLLYWIDGIESGKAGKDADPRIQIQVFHENSFASEKIAALFKFNILKKHGSWKVYLSSYDKDDFAGAANDKNYLFRKRISKEDFFTKGCNDVLTKARAIIIVGSVGFIRHTAISLYKATLESKFSYADFVLIGVPATLWPLPSYKAEDMMQLRAGLVKDSDDDIAKLAFRNMYVFTETFNTTRFNELSEVVKDNFYNGQPSLSSQNWTNNRPVPLWSGYTFDGALLLFKAMKENEDRADYYTFLLNKTWTASDFDGIEPFFGSIEINKYGDRVWRMNIHHFGKNFEWDIVGQKTYGVKGIQSDISVKSISWIGKRPSLYPKCGYEGCKGLSATARKYIYVVGIIFASILLVMLVAAVAYRMYKKDQDLKDLSWRVDVKDLVDLVNDLVPGDSETSVTGSTDSTATDLKDATRAKSVSLDSVQIAGGARKYFKNMHVFTKPLVSELFQFVFQDVKLMKELKYLRDLQCEFTVDVIGLTMDSLTGDTWLITEDCHKGTLADVLDDEDMEFDSSLQLSMIDDIATGMSFVHNKTNIGSHGNLKTSNILVSDNFTLKVADFGECVFRSDMKKMYHHSEVEKNKRLLWRAPELLRKKYIPLCGTKAGDVYSFALVVHEIINRQGPFNLHSLENTETPTSIILKVKDGTLDPPFRPIMATKVRNVPLRKIANQVFKHWWTEDSSKRDSFRQVSSKLKRITPQRAKGGTFLDRTVKRMEKFSNLVEEKACEKQAQVNAELKKVNDIREHFMPKRIIKAGLTRFQSEELEDTTIAVIELSGLSEALARGVPVHKIIDVDTTFRDVVDAIAHTTGCFIGDGNKMRRVWLASRVLGLYESDHVSTVNVVQEMLLQMQAYIQANLKDTFISVKAGLHTGSIKTGLVGDGESTTADFTFLENEVYDMADDLCSLSQGFEILVSPESCSSIKKALGVFNKSEEVDITFDWSAKQEFSSGKVIEAFCLKPNFPLEHA